jgi:hypothetical protein
MSIAIRLPEGLFYVESYHRIGKSGNLFEVVYVKNGKRRVKTVPSSALGYCGLADIA